MSKLNAEAPEFIPASTPSNELVLCAYFISKGKCVNGGACPYIHGFKCPHCQKHCLPPHDFEMRQRHIKLCPKMLIKEQILKKDETCGICQEIIVDKPCLGHRKFGVLSHCSHMFCMKCIMQWRTDLSYGSDLSKGDRKKCPICRVTSSHVIASPVWVKNGTDKKLLVEGYKQRLSEIPCNHYRAGYCPFQRACFYKHD